MILKQSVLLSLPLLSMSGGGLSAQPRLGVISSGRAVDWAQC